MTLRAAILEALSDGPLAFPALHARIGGKPAALTFALLRAYDAGLIVRTGKRRHYVYARVDGEPVVPQPRERYQREHKPVIGSDLASVWR